MTSTKDIIEALLNEKLIELKEKTEEVLYSKMAHRLQDKYEEFAPPIFEGKKLDPVDKDELKGKHKDRDDKDIDNDGDSDDSDKFLHKKRKAISKAIKKDEVDESSAARKAETRKKGGYKYGNKPGQASTRASWQQQQARDKGQGNQGDSNSLSGGSENIRKAKEVKKRAKERKLKAVADKRKALSRERETAERDAA